MNAIKNLAVKEGIVPPPISKLLDFLRKTGRLYEIDEFVAEERDYMGLPKIAAQSNFVKKILEKK
jgi:heterodisulfide reductase subunit C